MLLSPLEARICHAQKPWTPRPRPRPSWSNRLTGCSGCSIENCQQAQGSPPIHCMALWTHGGHGHGGRVSHLVALRGDRPAAALGPSLPRIPEVPMAVPAVPAVPTVPVLRPNAQLSSRFRSVLEPFACSHGGRGLRTLQGPVESDPRSTPRRPKYKRWISACLSSLPPPPTPLFHELVIPPPAAA